MRKIVSLLLVLLLMSTFIVGCSKKKTDKTSEETTR